MANKARTAVAQQRMALGTYGAQGDRLDWTFYDTQILSSTVTTHRYFVNGVGKTFTVGGNKTLADSNVISDGIPQGQNFRVHTINLLYKPDELRNNAEIQSIVDMMANTVLSFKIANKDVSWQATVQEAFGANYPIVLVPTVAGDNINTHLQSQIRREYVLKVPIDLAALTRYEIDMEHTEAVDASIDADKLQISLRGRLDRLS